MSEVEQVQFTEEQANNFANAQAEERAASQEAPKNSRPEWLQEKFQSPEDLAKAYDELEKKLGSRKPDTPQRQFQQEQAEQNEQTKQPDTPEQRGDSAPLLPGLDNDVVTQISDYAWEHQSLTDEHYQTLEQAGYSREMVDQYMAGQFAVAQDYHGQLMEVGGGEQNVEAMFAWAQQNLSEQQISAYDEMFDRGGPEAMMAMENLRAKYDMAGGSSVWSGVQGANAPGYEVGQFHSTADVLEAMGDPRYKTNPAYREEVARKLARSNVLNNGRA